MEHSILFSQPMCEAINAGRKSQTRRIIKGTSDLGPGFEHYIPLEHHDGSVGAAFSDVPEIRHGQKLATIYCPYGKPGDRLRFLSSWAAPKKYDAVKPLDLPHNLRTWTHFAGEKPKWAGKLRPGRFMPLFLRRRLPSAIIEAVRVQRVQDISREDALAEGVDMAERPALINGEPGSYIPIQPEYEFARLWCEIHGVDGPDSWQGNPWTWAVSFRMEAKP